MAGSDDFFGRFFGLSEDRVVEALKSVHRSRGRVPSAAGGAAPGLGVLVDLLRRVASPPTDDSPPPRGLAERTELPDQPDWNALPAPDWDATPLAPSNGPASEADAYERARAHFGEVEKRLRAEAKVSDALIDGLRERAPAPKPESAPAQQSLRLVALAGGVAGGRFVVASQGRAPSVLTFRHTGLREVGDGAAELDPAPVVSFDPASVSLTPGGSAVVRLWIDLSELPPVAGRFELCIDAMAEGAPEMKLFVEIDVHAPPGGDALQEESHG